jgi:PadR family transcriptional regulator, regulatory protein PadR
MRVERVRGQLDGLVLSVLEDGPAHGYAVIEELRARSGGVLDLAEGTVYPVLHRLEAAGSLVAEWTPGDGRRRRIYRLSKQGQTALADERASWQRFAAAFDAVLRPRGAAPAGGLA